MGELLVFLCLRVVTRRLESQHVNHLMPLLALSLREFPLTLVGHRGPKKRQTQILSPSTLFRYQNYLFFLLRKRLSMWFCFKLLKATVCNEKCFLNAENTQRCAWRILDPVFARAKSVKTLVWHKLAFLNDFLNDEGAKQQPCDPPAETGGFLPGCFLLMSLRVNIPLTCVSHCWCVSAHFSPFFDRQKTCQYSLRGPATHLQSSSPRVLIMGVVGWFFTIKILTYMQHLTGRVSSGSSTRWGSPPLPFHKDADFSLSVRITGE